MYEWTYARAYCILILILPSRCNTEQCEIWKEKKKKAKKKSWSLNAVF